MDVIVELSHNSVFEDGPVAMVVDITVENARVYLDMLDAARDLKRVSLYALYHLTSWAFNGAQLFEYWGDWGTPFDGEILDEIPEEAVFSDAFHIGYLTVDAIPSTTSNIGEDYVRFQGGYKHGCQVFCSGRIYRDVLEDIAKE